MLTFLSVLITPAVVSLLVSLWAGRFLEAQRARRDHVTKLFEAAREDVRRAGEVAVVYFATPPGQRTALEEARVIAADKELRAAIPALLVLYPADPTAHEPIKLQRARVSYMKLIAELTGGNFQATAGVTDKRHILQLVYAAAGMRSALADWRDDQLRTLYEDDWFAVRYDQARLWLSRHSPVRMPGGND